MTNKLISLVLLIFFLVTSYSYAEDQFLFPKKKPSVFKKIQTNIGSESSENLTSKETNNSNRNKKKQNRKNQSS